MKVLFNALIATEKSFGYSTVVCSYLQCLGGILAREPEAFDGTIVVVCQKRALSAIDPTGALRQSGRFEFVVVPDLSGVVWRMLYEQVMVNLLALRHGCDLIHMPATHGLVFPLRQQLLFFHNSGTFLLPRSMHGRSPLSTWVNNLIIRASALRSELTATTRTTAEELLSYLGRRLPYEVVGNGVKRFEAHGATPDPEMVARLSGKRFLLYVSSFYGLKNQRLLIDLFERFALPDLTLVLVGAPAQEDYYQACVARITQPNIIVTQATDASVNWLYQNCALYVNPSLFEGFSLTPLEALSHEAPAMLSDIPVHREVYGEGFFYFDPNDLDSLRTSLNQAIDPTYREQCRQQAARLFEEHSWTNFTRKNLALYRRLANQGSLGDQP